MELEATWKHRVNFVSRWTLVITPTFCCLCISSVYNTSLCACVLMRIQIWEHFRLFSDVMFSKHQVAGMSKIFCSLYSSLITGILADLWHLWFETWSPDENTCICFCRGDQIISCMLQNCSAALSTNQVCCARKHKIKCACLQFFFIWEGAFKIQISGVAFSWFFPFSGQDYVTIWVHKT